VLLQAQGFRGIQSSDTDAVTNDRFVLDADDPASASHSRCSNAKCAQLSGDLAVEALLVLTIASRDQAGRENWCWPQSLHVRHANSQDVTVDYQSLSRERLHFGDEYSWHPQSKPRARAEQEPSTSIIGATQEV
jgi:hypothetical protein